MKKATNSILPNNPVYKYVEALKDYMAEKEIDFAYMLDGNWGSGKTYFISHELKTSLKTLGYTVVHTSLYGKSSIEQVNKDFFSQILFHKKKTKKIELGKSLIQTISNTEDSKLGIVVGTISEIANYELERKLENNNYGTKVLFVIDDVERCNPEIVCDLLGAIHSQYTENGYHVLFVADESKLLNNEEYKEKKEKIIRTTIRFSYSDISDVIVSIIEREKSEPIFRLYRKDTAGFFEFVKMVQRVENLRTWLASFSYYNLIVTKCDYDDTYPFLLQLFIGVFTTTHYLKTQIELFDTPTISFDEDEITLEKTIKKEFGIDCFWGFDSGKDFKLLHQYPGMIKYGRLKSIELFIRSGYLDTSLIKAEMDSFFPVGTRAEKALAETYHIEEISQVELERCFEGIFQGITNNEFSLERLIGISRLFEKYEEIGYLGLFGEKYQGYKDLLKKCVIHLPEEKLGHFFSYHRFEGCGYSDYLKNPNFLEESIKELANKYYNPNVDKEEFIAVFSNIGDYRYYEINSEVKTKMIEKARDYNLFSKVLTFRCKDIASVSLYLYDISRFDNSGDHYYSEIEPLEELKNYIGNSLTTMPMNKQKIELQLFIGKIEEAICKIRKTRKNTSIQ